MRGNTAVSLRLLIAHVVRSRWLRRLTLVLGTALTLLLFCRIAAAQECRIYTVVYDDSVEPSGIADRTLQNRILARSLSLAHAGKVYDSIDSVGEIIIFEPAQRRFRVLNTRHSLAATVSFDEIKHMLKPAYDATAEYAAKMESGSTPRDLEKAAALRFQLQPQFAEEYDADRRLLTLSSPSLRYTVRCADDRPAEAVESYLRYADWMSRLNYLLHPNVLLPEPRLALNEALRSRGLIPYEVQLQANLNGVLRLRAEHQIAWELGTRDRSLIREWEQLLEDEHMRTVTLRQYQAALFQREFSKR